DCAQAAPARPPEIVPDPANPGRISRKRSRAGRAGRDRRPRRRPGSCQCPVCRDRPPHSPASSFGTPRMTAPSSIGVLLVNLGTPDAPEPDAVRRYLAEFLSDRRVVEIPRLIWQPILRGIILRTRPRKSAHAYRQVWTEAGSPLAAITQAQAAALQSALKSSVRVAHAMRYGNPAIGPTIDRLIADGCERILVA